MPPLDYVSTDGSPVGFNVALLAALSEEMNVNFELVTSNACSRVSMLTSGKADVICWMRNYYVEEDDGSALTSKSNLVHHAIKTTPSGVVFRCVTIHAADGSPQA